MSQDCTDEAGKVKSSNPFIEEPAQSNTVVDMKGNLPQMIYYAENNNQLQLLF